MTITTLVRQQAQERPGSVFLSLPDGTELTYQGLEQCLDRYAGMLQARGLGLECRVAIALSNPLEEATSILCVAAGASAAPLYPNLPGPEYARVLKALDAKLLISDSVEAAQAAAELGIDTIVPSRDWPMARAEESDFHTGLVICSSGSTGIPKLIPRAESHFIDSNLSSASKYEHRPEDLTLSPLALCHSFGLAMLGLALCAGGHLVLCSPFEPVLFAQLLRERRPTLLSLPPTMLQAVLEQLRDTPLEGSRLRYIGTGASHLSTTLQDEIEAYFGVPLIEGYGSTEVNAVAVQPLPPAKPKRGSVGLPCVEIRFEENGEIVVRAPYPTTLLKAGEWWHTGDLGYLDEDGFLFLTGRSREMINRGAQVIAPREIEEVISQHPGVDSVACYSIPHGELGEEVGATVVLRDRNLTREELMAFAAERLSFAKMPKQLVFRNQLELGPSGKPLRVDVVPPRLLEIWSQVFGGEVKADDNFFDLGGYSLQAAELMIRIKKDFGTAPSLDSLFVAPTPRAMSSLLRKGESELPVPLNHGGKRQPLFFVCIHAGSSHFFLPLARRLSSEVPCFGVHSKPIESYSSVAEFLDAYITQIRAIQPDGPYRLAGVSMGGEIARQVATKLMAEGQSVQLLILIDTPNAVLSPREFSPTLKISFRTIGRVWRRLLDQAHYQWVTLRTMRPELRSEMLKSFINGYLNLLPFFRRFVFAVDPHRLIPKLPTILAVAKKLEGQTKSVYTGQALLLKARFQESERLQADPTLGWGSLMPHLKVATITGEHQTILWEPWVQEAAKAIEKALDRVEKTAQSVENAS